MNARGRRNKRQIELRERLDVLLALCDEVVRELQQVATDDENPAVRRPRLRAVK
jgi:hypothetical protein